MNHDLKLAQTIEIEAGPEAVWDTLTNPQKNRRLFAGTNIVTDWRPGSPMLFEGEFQGQRYTDKGNVLEAEPGRRLRYNYWTGFSGLDDRPENYSLVTYTLNGAAGQTTLTVTRVGFADEQEYEHAVMGWEMVVKTIKEIAEEA